MSELLTEEQLEARLQAYRQRLLEIDPRGEDGILGASVHQDAIGAVDAQLREAAQAVVEGQRMRQCMRKGCEERAVWAVGFSFKAVGGSENARGRAQANVMVCDPHKQAVNLDELFEPGWKEKLEEGLASLGLPPPDRESIRAEFEAIQ